MRLTLLAIGKARGEIAALCADYAKRMTGRFELRELEPKPATAEKESAALLAAVPAGAKILICDERGKSLTSVQLAEQLRRWQDDGVRDLACLIGGADGHTPTLRERADLLISFGQLTWPHMLARVMLTEQLYRAQQINSGHPYHREG